ncbi:MAG: acetate--CoA ligase [Candidatus Hinthialibacter antarcticus]|nr:acetate--CoA ligase [Candidatus Hinthialibacter antarcticus]
MSSEKHAATIDALLEEKRHFDPPKEFAENANVKDNSPYELAEKDRIAYWEQQAEGLDWFQKWDTALEWDAPNAKWFVGGKLNASYNCLDRHIKNGLRNRAAIIWEGEPGDQRTLTYWDMYREVNKFANCLKGLGVKKGDRVTFYMPMIPELAIGLLACARIGAVHSVVFGGFSPDALKDRIHDCESTVLITADGGYRRGNLLPLKHDADIALRDCPTIEHVVIVKRGDFPLHIKEGRDHWYHRLMQEADPYCEPEPMDAEDLLFVLYTSGTTGKPKGIMHTTGGYMTGVTATTEKVFDLKRGDVYWCTADIGWITGHSYIVYGPMANAATQIMYEGAPDWPDRDRFWEIIEKYGVSVFYTAPTAIRAFMKWGDQEPKKHDLSSLRLLGSVGEPINPEAWMWYHKVIGGERCPIVDTWWQTETGAIMITPLPGVTRTTPGSATKPFPGVVADIVTEEGEHVEVGGGYLVLKEPWPSMLRGIYGDPERFKEVYWSKYDGIYFAGDGAKRDEDGYYWILGRVDDVMNVAGHRISTMEVESALVDHKAVAESAVIGIDHELKGTSIAAFVTIREGYEMGAALEKALKDHVVQKIGAIARPEKIIFSADLPKTRSGKIMRRLLRDIADGRALGDTTTLADASVVQNLQRNYEE